jgi:hypothetical protein
MSIHAIHGKIDTNKHKDTRTGKECRLGFVDMILILCGYKIVAYDEYDYREYSYPSSGQV